MLAAAVSSVGSASADTVYRCVGSDGVVAFQDHPCAGNKPQTVLHLRDVAAPPAPAPTASPPATRSAPSVPNVVAKPAAKPAPPPLPALYTCTNAVNGDHYVSRNGHPPPYTAPLGMVDIARQPLSQAYGAGGGSHLSAPELSRSPPNLGRGIAYSVWVQDVCRPLSRRETCAQLRHERDANAAKLKYAFGDGRGALQQRARQLATELAGCR